MENTTQNKIEMLQRVINGKLEDIAYYINNGEGECALIELESLAKFQNLQKETMLESVPGKFI